MILGLFLAIGESFTDFKNKGQDQLLIKYNLKTYSENFDKVYVFSYGNESLTFFKNVYVLPNKCRLNRYLYSFLLPLFYPKIILSCDAFRGLQITGGIPAVLAKLLFRKKIVINYGYSYPQVALIEGKRIRSFLYKLLERIILPISDTIIVTTLNLKKYISSFSKRIVLIPNGVDTKLFKPLKNIKKKFSVIYVGRLEKQKNLQVLIKATSLLDKNNKKILMIGDGSLKNFLLRQAKEKKVNLEIQNKVPHHLLPRYYNQARLFILPSILEGHPKALIEAMSCGLPVIGNDVPGINSVIQNEKNGLLFKKTSESLKRKIDLLLQNRKLREKLGANARRFVLENYNYLDLKQKEVDVLKDN